MMAAWQHGSMAAWQHGSMADGSMAASTWQHGSMAASTWQHGSISMEDRDSDTHFLSGGSLALALLMCIQ
jgi:hypothetical protein